MGGRSERNGCVYRRLRRYHTEDRRGTAPGDRVSHPNIGSYSTAAAIGMRIIKEYPDPEDTVLYVYAITRSEWEAMEKDQNI